MPKLFLTKLYEIHTIHRIFNAKLEKLAWIWWNDYVTATIHVIAHSMHPLDDQRFTTETTLPKMPALAHDRIAWLKRPSSSTVTLMWRPVGALGQLHLRLGSPYFEIYFGWGCIQGKSQGKLGARMHYCQKFIGEPKMAEKKIDS